MVVARPRAFVVHGTDHPETTMNPTTNLTHDEAVRFLAVAIRDKAD